MEAVTKLDVEGTAFDSVIIPPGSSKTHFLGGAGVRGLEIGGKFIAFTAIGIYLETDSIPFLADKWKGKTGEELAGSLDFFRDICTGPFEKFTNVTMILPLTGEQYSEKVTENCVAYWKAIGIYTDAEASAVDKFKQAFKPESFPPGSSILFTHTPSGTLKIAFSKDGSVSKDEGVLIENKALTQAVLESIIGEHGVSPAAKLSIASRLSEIMNKVGNVEEKLPVLS
uniref:Chalcone--flavanone isomerase n=1 Tax=Allium cepa TaxID=4679 RepID=CFI_ALLCE|nr:RecName: Full=Chalcone--flavanone isomerase; Short=Chalcone isomerase [Allium cepa]AAS48418.1 chalcone isomerase [Allium cepa]AAU11845.1 chalcone isomerase [Allium cepa]